MEPDLKRLTVMLGEVTTVLVVSGGYFDPRHRKANQVLGRAGDPEAMTGLRAALRCVPGGARMDWMTPGDPTLALFSPGRRYLTAVTVVGPDFVRSPGLLEGDVPLAEPQRLLDWLAAATGTR